MRTSLSRIVYPEPLLANAVSLDPRAGTSGATKRRWRMYIGGGVLALILIILLLIWLL
jgi:hypothetical protein